MEAGRCLNQECVNIYCVREMCIELSPRLQGMQEWKALALVHYLLGVRLWSRSPHTHESSLL